MRWYHLDLSESRVECQKMNGYRCQTAAGEARIWQGIRPGKRREVHKGSVVQESGVDIDICKMKMKTSYHRWIDKENGRDVEWRKSGEKFALETSKCNK